MLRQRLGTFITTGQVKNLFLPGEEARILASQSYRRRKAAVDALTAQVTAGLWRSPEVTAAVDTAQRDHWLLWFDDAKFIAACGGGHDLDIEYRPLAQGLSGKVEEADFLGALGFLAHFSPEPEHAQPWMEALRLEAEAYLYQLWGDWHLEQAIAKLGTVEEAVLLPTAGRAPYDPAAIQAHATVMQMYRLLGLPWRVEAAYRSFCATFGGGDPSALWEARVAADNIFKSQTGDSFRQIFAATIPTLKLHNPKDRSELARLESLQGTIFPPLMLHADGVIVPLPTLSPQEFEKANDVLGRIVAALPTHATRAGSVLRAWQAVALQGMYRFLDLVATLHDVDPDDEALGVLVLSLRGEARYRVGSYEDACLDLRHVERQAKSLLARASADPLDLSPAARGFLTRIARKTGNALLAVGAEAQAEQAYDRAREWLSDDPLAQASDSISRGNLAYLRNNLANERGYVTLDGTLRLKMATEGPQALQKEKMKRHVASLTEAEQHYWQALKVLSHVSLPNATASELKVAAHVNLGNTAWAWGRAMEAEGAQKLEQLPLDEGWQSSLVQLGFSRTDCYLAAIQQQKSALAALPPAGTSDPSQQATAWSNLSEFYYLLGEQSGDPAHLEEGVAAAKRVLQGMDAETTALHPELVWRTQYNLARLYQDLGQPQKAQAHYQEAIQAIEDLRANLRLDAWQATFLHDKLEVYEGLIRFLYSRDPDDNAAEIFELMEKTKARAFLDLLEGARLDIGLPQELVDRRDDLLAQVAACNDDIRQAMLADDESKAMQRLEDQRRFALLWDNLQSEIAAIQQHDQDLNPPLASLGETQQALGPDTVLLMFLLGLRDSYLLLVDEAHALVFELPDRRTLELAALPVLYYCSWSSAEKKVCARFRDANAALVEHLLGSLDARVGLRKTLTDKHVLIVPDGILHYLPFEALLADRSHLDLLDGSVEYADLTPYYLLDFATVSYAPSASAWLQMARRPMKTSGASLLAVYNIRYDVGEAQRPLWAQKILLNLSDVPGAHTVTRVANAIQETWPNQQMVYLRARKDDGQPEDPGFQSTEDNLLRVAADTGPRFLLFSGHGIYNDKYPSLSGLILNQKPSSGAEAASTPGDGFLHVEELFRLDLPGTELSFLAACQTALGTVYRGEGLNALTRAFMYRGSPAVIASLWAVDSEATSRLLRWFFERVAQHQEADRAQLLCEAKRQVMGFGKVWCLPYFWAPFILCGVSRPRRCESVDSVSENGQ
jgi:CHAT domain-containing protein/tetratricopeptide (TPR) repeat protein